MPAILLVIAAAMATMAGAAFAQAGVATREAQAEDLAAFRRDFLDVDRSYSRDARKAAERRLAALKRVPAPLSPAAFVLELCRIAAMADNGHSQCLATASPRAPLEFMPIDGGFYLVGAGPEDAPLLGSRLVSIDGRSAASLITAGRTLRGGLKTYRDAAVADLMRKPADLHALGLANDSGAALYRLRTRDGRLVERRFAGTLSGTTAPALTRLPPPETAPWALQAPDEPFRWRDAPEIDAVIVQLRRNADLGERRIMALLIEAEAARERLGRANVILDERYSPGGNLQLTNEFFTAWPSKLPANGRIFVLVGPRTFSAAIAAIGYLKQAGGDRVILVGSPPGDRLVFFAEGRQVVLPRSGQRFLPAPERHDYRNGCRAFVDCHVAVAQPQAQTASPPENAAQTKRLPITVKTLDPDIKAPWTLEALVTGRDPGMEAVAAVIVSSGAGRR
jgi:hypothetical protein